MTKYVANVKHLKMRCLNYNGSLKSGGKEMITKYGKVTIDMDENNDPRVVIEGFHIDYSAPGDASYFQDDPIKDWLREVLSI